MRQVEPQPDASDSLAGEASFIEIPCLICGGDQTDIIASRTDLEDQQRLLQAFHRRRRRTKVRAGLADRVEFTQDYSTRIVQCRSCGLVFRTPRPSVSAVTGAYIQDRYNDAHLQSEFLSQRTWARKKAAFLASCMRLPPRPVIVEVGSFVGGFLDAGRQRGWSMLGIDPGKEVTAFCHERGLPVYCGTLADAPIASASVDVVAIWNTFDQLPNPDTTLAAARRALRDEGRLIIRVPNGIMYRWGAERLEREGTGRQWITAALAWNNLLGFPYLHGYSIATLDQLLGRHGFRRLAFSRDTLMALSDPDTKAWAMVEEKVIKWWCRWAGAVESVWSKDSTRFTPWLDVYYGLGKTISRTPVSVARDYLSVAPAIPR
ncbi:MAG TPA: methyltransferase domain-containing protein [Nitrospiraceae bacterium]|nr:methyltransferase domain-containing protein [Nitrospiraceae bacterium]